MTRRLLYVLLCFLPFIGMAQESEPLNEAGYKNGLKFSTFKLFSSTFQVDYERITGNASSIVLCGNVSAGTNWYEERFGFGTEMQYRWYFNPWEHLAKKSEHTTDFYGMYVAPFGQYGMTNVREEVTQWDWETGTQWVEEATGTYNNYGGGVVMGFQIAIHHKFLLDFYTGGIARYSQRISGSSVANIDRDVLSPIWTGVSPRVGLKLGVAF